MKRPGTKNLANGICIALFCLLFSPPALRAQIGTSGALVGTVRDSSGAVLPGAKVTATHTATGAAQAATTDAEGRFRIPLLPPGEYQVEASLPGFESQVHSGIVLTVAKTQEMDFTLSVGQVSEKVTVSGGAPLVETTSSSLSGLVNDQEVRSLPLNGRSFDQLITLSSGTVMFSQRLTNAFRGPAAQYSAGGSRPGTTKMMVDGAELAGAGGTNTNMQSASGKLLGVEAIQEFAVVTNNGDASFGKRVGGQVNIVTHSGTNAFHGSVYEFLRNDVFDARNFFAADKSPLRQNNFGFAAGGPVVRNKTFFFTNTEWYRERRGVTGVAVVPSAAARQGIFPNGTKVQVNPVMQPIINLYPAPNGPDFGDGTAEAITPARRTVNDTYVLGRLDHNFSGTDSLFGRYLIQTGERFEPNDAGLGQSLENSPFRTQLASLSYKKTISSRFVNQSTFTFNRGSFLIDIVPRPGLTVPPAMILIPGQTKPGAVSIGVQGSTTVHSIPVLFGNGGTGGTVDQYVNRNVFGLSDQVNYSVGPHFFEWGAEVQRIQSNDFLGIRSRGFVAFASLQTFITGVPNQVRGPLQGSNSHDGWRQVYVGPYFQDSWKVRRALTVNLGLRWELMTNPVEVNGRTAAFVPIGGQLGAPLPNAATLTSHVFAENHSGDFAPRIGFAWDPFGTGKTSIRGGFGLFYDQIQNEFRYALTTGPPFWNVTALPNPSFPNPGQLLLTTTVAPAGSLQVAGIQQSPGIPTTIQYNLQIERSIAPETVLALGYAGSHSYHLFRSTNPQIPTAFLNADGRLQVPQQVMNPTLNSSATFGVWDATASYNSLQLKLQRRLSRGLQFKAAFTWSKTLDEGTEYIQSPNGTAQGGSISANRNFDRGLAAFHVGRRLVADWIYDLPLHPKGRAANALFGGWELTGILQAQDGFPFSVFDGIGRSFAPGSASASYDRPDLLSGRTTGNIILGSPNQYFDPTAFQLQPAGVLGKVGANTLIGPGLVNVDSSLSKSFRPSERITVQFRAEVFNLFNRANFGLPNNSLFQSASQRLGSAGLTTTTATDSREFQFSLKLLF